MALARPVHVAANGRTYAEPTLPARGTDVLVVLDRPRSRARRDAEIVTLQLDVDGEPKPATVFADSADRVYAVWYGVEGWRARVVAKGHELTFSGREFRLVPRGVITVRGQFRPLPQLRVEIAPSADLPDQARVQATRLSGEILTDVPLDDMAVDLGHLPAEPIEVVLLSPDIELHQRADLTKGIDDTVQFRPDALTIHGSLIRGERGVRGSITFTLGARKPVTVATNDDGTYTARLWTAGTYRISATASGTAPFQVTRPLVRDTELNIKLPRSTVVIEIIDEKTRAAVAGATIVAMPGRGETTHAISRAQRAVTDDQGSATLPPIEPGTIQLSVRRTITSQSSACFR